MGKIQSCNGEDPDMCLQSKMSYYKKILREKDTTDGKKDGFEGELMVQLRNEREEMFFP